MIAKVHATCLATILTIGDGATRSNIFLFFKEIRTFDQQERVTDYNDS